ncbi:hypothetical protein NEIMUCOT_04209 [Neisseria mucosa ATCC 25996]|uniref:Uncharacterized protein n=1 Tax=Neisseria mucosa (strain ATCC 25996 / DSM 4631 / NCTC 10774 / M26) TaxID=546266 RepID=D2ZUC1_NEIM2|nr:hypothetical protein NEIMUCOT_04209 [Neisseria mucosa ATCC 25996]
MILDKAVVVKCLFLFDIYNHKNYKYSKHYVFQTTSVRENEQNSSNPCG